MKLKLKKQKETTLKERREKFAQACLGYTKQLFGLAKRKQATRAGY